MHPPTVRVRAGQEMKNSPSIDDALVFKNISMNLILAPQCPGAWGNIRSMNGPMKFIATEFE
jgi:hypothetical protein